MLDITNFVLIYVSTFRNDERKVLIQCVRINYKVVIVTAFVFTVLLLFYSYTCFKKKPYRLTSNDLLTKSVCYFT